MKNIIYHNYKYMTYNPRYGNNEQPGFININAVKQTPIMQVNKKNNELLQKKEDDKIDSKYIIKNKPKVKVVREYFKNKCDSIIDEDIKQFEK